MISQPDLRRFRRPNSGVVGVYSAEHDIDKAPALPDQVRALLTARASGNDIPGKLKATAQLETFDSLAYFLDLP